MQQAAVELSRQGLNWLNTRMQEAFDEHGRLGPDDFAQLDWPDVPPLISSRAGGMGSGQAPDIRGTVYERLKQAARANIPVTYGEIAALIGLDMSRVDHRDQIADLLGEISESEHKLGRPMLSVVAVHSEQGEPAGIPGKGFFKLAKQLGLQRNEDDVTFFVREFARAHATWRE